MELVFLGGSLRQGSLNRRLMGYLAREVSGRGHSTHVFQGEDLRIPLYEDGLPVPDSVNAMAVALRASQGAMIVSPEYNAGIPGHLKNLLDWLSTQQPNPWTGLPVLLAAASPGAFGGSRGMLSWRASLANVGAWAAPASITVPRADVNLAEDGTPKEDRAIQEIRRALDAFLAGAERMGRGKP
jgi:chromate reductase, NAD(P)H dehydrogenase (quinone)